MSGQADRHSPQVHAIMLRRDVPPATGLRSRGWTCRGSEHGRARLARRRLSHARRGPDGRAGTLPPDEAQRYRDGETLFEAGDRDFKFFVVKSGEVEIVDESGETPKTVTVHGPGEFTGDVAHLTGSPASSAPSPGAIAKSTRCRPTPCGNSSTTTRTWATSSCRRSSPAGSSARIGRLHGLRVIGSRYSQDTFRVRDFLAKNRVPFTWLDLEADPHVKRAAQAFRA